MSTETAYKAVFSVMWRELEAISEATSDPYLKLWSQLCRELEAIAFLDRSFIFL